MGSNSSKRQAKNDESINNNYSKLVLDAEPPDLTEEHIKSIKQNWEKVKSNVSKVGVVTFLRYVVQ